jgi:outer membrane murein-binding lipoprotein Lpp
MKSKLFAVVMAVAMIAGCASQKPSGKMENVLEARATVTAIDLSQREITLKDAKGDAVDVQVPDEVKNLDQIRVGDEVVISYTEAIAWQVKPASKGAPGVSADAGVSTAQPGDKPGGKIGRTITLTATITKIDLANGTVTLTGPGGTSKTIKARDPSNLKKVQVGDLVDISYTEAMAVSVKPVAKK